MWKESNRVSIIIPVYNVEKFLKRCLDSVISQSHSNLDIILINDGSSDGSGEICDQYALKDKRVTVIHKQNEGLSEARNDGLKIARGDYVFFVDSDDYIHRETIERLLDTYIKTGADMVVCGRYRFDAVSLVDVNKLFHGFTRTKIEYSRESALVHLFTDMTYIRHASWDKFCRLEVYNDIYFPKDRIYEDGATTYKLIDRCSKVIYISDPLYYYAVNPHSITEMKYTSKHFHDHIETLKSAVEYFKNEPYIKDAALSWNTFEMIKIWRRLKLVSLDNEAKELHKIFRNSFNIKAVGKFSNKRNVVNAVLFYTNPVISFWLQRFYQIILRK